MYDFDNFAAVGESTSKVVDLSQKQDYNLTVNPNRDGVVTGKYNSALNFTARSGANASNVVFGREVTYDFWFRLRQVGITQYIAAGCFDPDSACTGGNYNFSGVYIGATNNLTIAHFYKQSARTVYVGTVPTFAVGIWYHVVASINTTANSGYIYVNGIKQTVKVTTVGTGSIPNFPLSRFSVGALADVWSNSNLNKLNGTVDNFRMFNRTVPVLYVNASYLSNLQKYNKTQWYLRRTETLPNSAYVFKVQDGDMAKNVNTTSYYTRIDITSPVVTYNPSSVPAGYNRTGIYVNVSSTDPNNITYMRVIFMNGSGYVLSTRNVTGGSWMNKLNYSDVFTGLTNASYRINVTANDTFNNLGSSRRSITIDTINPIVTTILPTYGNKTVQSQTFNMSVVERNLRNVTLGIKNNTKAANTSYYSDNLVLMVNYDNLASLGESTALTFDSSRYRSNGTMSGMVYRAGKYGNSIKFGSGIVTTDFHPSVLFNTTAGAKNTVEGWMYMGPSMQGRFIDSNYLIYGVQAQTCWGFLPNGGGGVLGFNPTTYMNGWHHFAVVFYNGYPSRAQNKIYIDGVVQTLSYCSGYTNLSTTVGSYLRIGTTGVSDAFNGSVDEIRAWNRELTQTEVQEHMKGNLQRTNRTQWYLRRTENMPTSIYNLKTYAGDLAKNTNASSQYIRVDYTAPVVTFVGASTGVGVKKQRWIYVNASQTDYSGNLNITIQLFNRLNGLVSKQFALNRSTYAYNFTGLPDTIYHINISASDGLGNIGRNTRDVVLDTNIGVSYITPTPKNGTWNTTQYLNVSIAEQNLSTVNMSYSIVGGQKYNMTYFGPTLKLHVSFDNNANIGETGTRVMDDSKLYRRGTMMFTPNYKTGKYGNAMNFTKGVNYVNFTDSTDFTLGSKFTVEAWIAPSDVADNWKSIMGTYTGSAGWIFAISNTPNNVLSLYQGNAWATCGDSRCYMTENNQWRHVAAVVSGTQVRFYVNGINVNNQTVAAFTGDGGELQIGNGGTGFAIASYGFAGRIDNAEIYNRTLSSEEMKWEYYSNLDRFNKTQWYIQSKIWRDGNQTFIFTANDAVFNVNSTSRQIVQNGYAPTVSLVAPTASTGVYNRTSIRVNVSSTSTIFKNTRIYLFNKTGLVVMKLINVTPSFYNFTGLPSGRYYINATSNDSFDRRNSTNTINYILDTTRPAIILTSIVNNTYYSVYPKTINVSINENVTSCKLSVVGNVSSDIGDGAQGSLVVASAGTVVNTYVYMLNNTIAGKSIVYVSSVAGFTVGDEILVIQMQNNTATASLGKYESMKIASIGTNNFVLTKAIVNSFYSGTFNAVDSTVAQIVRVPRYTSVTVNTGASIVSTAWDGYSGGVVSFKVNGLLNVSGSIDVSGRGFRGGVGGANGCSNYPWPTTAGDRGESFRGTNSVTACNRRASVVGHLVAVTPRNGGGGGGAGSTSSARNGGGGGGGSYGVQGAAGSVSSSGENGGQPGAVYNSVLSYGMALGSGGGGGGRGVNAQGGAGGIGGGIIYIGASRVIITGTVVSNGGNGNPGLASDDGSGGGGGGSGGSVILKSPNLNIGTSKVGVTGGALGAKYGNGGNGGAGGAGRIGLEYNTLTGTAVQTPVKSNLTKGGSYSKVNITLGVVNKDINTYAQSNILFNDGTQKIYAFCTDNIGFTAFTKSYNFTIDTISPVVSYNSPTLANNSFVSGSSIMINVSVVEANFINSTTSIYSGGVLYSKRSSTSKSYTANFTGLVDGGVYVVNTTAIDVVGFKGYQKSRIYYMDSSMPSIKLVEPTKPSMIDGINTVINITFNDNNIDYVNFTWKNNTKIKNLTFDYDNLVTALNFDNYTTQNITQAYWAGNGVRGLWHLNEVSGTLADSSGNANTCTAVGSPGYGAVGRFGTAMQFGASGRYLNCGTSATLLLKRTGTLSVWINRTGTPGAGLWPTIVGKGADAASDTNGYSIGWNGNTNVICGWLANRTGSIRTNEVCFGATSLNKWYLITMTWDGSRVVSYLNGIPIQNISQTINAETTSEIFIMGALQEATSHFYTGMIDEVYVNNKALTTREVKAMYQESKYYDSSKLNRNYTGYMTTGYTSANNGVHNTGFNNSVDTLQYITSSWDTRMSSVAGTVCMNMKMRSTSGAYWDWWVGDEGSQANYLGGYDSGGRIYVAHINNSATVAQVFTGVNKITDTKWHYVCWSSSGSVYKIYIDGVSQTLNVSAGSNNGNWLHNMQSPDNIQLFGYRYLNYGASNGNRTYDDVLWFNRSLSDDSVAALYNMTYNKYNNNYALTFYKNNLKGAVNYSYSGLIKDDGGNINTTETRWLIASRPVVIEFKKKNPADITSLNLFGTNKNVTITYNMTSGDGINKSSAQLWYKTNNSKYDGTVIFNGTRVVGFVSYGVNVKNVSSNFTFTITEANVYPAEYPIEPGLFYINTPNFQNYTTINSSGYMAKLRFMRNDTRYNMYEFMARNWTNNGLLHIIYCNRSYGKGQNWTTTSNCIQAGSIAAIDVVNHTHTQYNKHYLISVVINVTSGKIGTVAVTNTSYFILEPESGNWSVSSLRWMSKPDTVQYSSNQGLTWVNKSFSLNTHLHQYSGSETLWYRSYIKNNVGGSNYSSYGQDLLELGGLAPSGFTVLSPLGRQSRLVNISHTEGQSPNNYNMANYTYWLVYENATVRALINYNGLNRQYIWNSSAFNGTYQIKIRGCDSMNQCTTIYSEPFNLYNNSKSPIVSIMGPINGITIGAIPVEMVCNATDEFNLGVLGIKIFNGTDVLYRSNRTLSVSLYASQTWNYNFTKTGKYNWSCFASDGRWSGNSSLNMIRADLSPPLITFVTPTPTNASYKNNSIIIINVSVNENVSTCFEQVTAFGGGGLDWFNSSWPMRKRFNVSSSVGTPRGYQLKLILTSANVGTFFDWSRGCVDIRFANKTKGELNYWVSGCDSVNQNATVWVKFDGNITSTPSYFYMYYGNSAAVTKSSARNTFFIYDQFENATRMPGCTGIFEGYSWISGGQYAQLAYAGSGVAGGYSCIGAKDLGVGFEATYRQFTNSVCGVGCGDSFTMFSWVTSFGHGGGNGWDGYGVAEDDVHNVYEVYYNGTTLYGVSNYNTAGWRDVKVRSYNGNFVRWTNGGLYLNYTDPSFASRKTKFGDYFGWVAGEGEWVNIYNLDDVSVRMYVSPEPTIVSKVGSEGVTKSNLTMTKVNNNANTYAYLGISPSQGSHDYKVICWDEYFNQNSTKTRNVTIDRTAPTVQYLYSTPNDLDIFNAINKGLNITYNITDNHNLNKSTIMTYMKTNSTLNDCTFYMNGTKFCGYMVDHHYNFTNPINGIYRVAFDDNDVYPGTYNIESENMENTIHKTLNLTANSQYDKIEILNFSSQKRYAFFEIMASTVSGSGPLRMYICNQSYVTGVVPGANCALFLSLGANTPYNHSHHEGVSYHHVAILPVNTTTGTVLGKGISPKMYFVVRGATGSVWSLHVVPLKSRTAALQLSTNSGGAYTSSVYTVDAHVHQYYGDERNYRRLLICDYAGNCVNSTVTYDPISLRGIPPTSPDVYEPQNITYVGMPVPVNYTQAYSFNNYSIANYSIYLLNADYSFNRTLVANNQLRLNYTIDMSVVGDGGFVVDVRACDVVNQCSHGYSEVFSNVNDIIPPLVEFVYPTVQQGGWNKPYLYFNVSASDNIMVENVTLHVYNSSGYNSFESSIYGSNLYINYTSIVSGTYKYNATAYDAVGNKNHTRTYNLSVDFNPPIMSHVTPVNYTITNVVSRNFTCNATDDIGLENISVTLWSRFGSVLMKKTNVLSSVRYNKSTWNFNFTESAKIFWECSAGDAFNVGRSSNYTIYFDTGTPAISFADPTTASGYSKNGWIGVNVSASDPLLDTVKIKIYNGSNVLINTTTSYNENTFVNLTGLADGLYRFNATANDSAGQMGYTITNFVVLDTQVPYVSFTSAADNNGTVARRYVLANVSIYDKNLQIAYVRLYNMSGDIVANKTVYGSKNIKFDNLQQGRYFLNATAFDNAGWKSAVTTRNITIDLLGPDYRFVYPTPQSETYTKSMSIAANLTAYDSVVTESTIWLWNATETVDSYFCAAAIPCFHNFSGLSDGIYYLNASGYDDGDMLGSSTTHIIRLSTIPPKVYINGPASGNYTNPNFTFNMTVLGSAVNVFNMSWNNITTNTNYTFLGDGLVFAAGMDHNTAIGDTLTEIRDFTSNSNNGTITGATYVAGKYSNGMNFNVNGRKVKVSNVPVNMVAGGKNTVEFWFYRNYHTMIWPDNYFESVPFAFQDVYALNWVSNTCFGFNTGVSGTLGFNPTGLGGGWHHISAVFYNGVASSSNSKIYIDGVEKSLAVCGGLQSPVSKSVSGTFWIGNVNDDAQVRWDGVLDEVRIWNRELSSTQIKQNYYSNIRLYNETKLTFVSSQVVSDGNYTIMGYAHSAYGLENRSTIKINIDSTKPVASFVYPTTESGYKRASWISANITASDRNGIKNASIMVFNGSSIMVNRIVSGTVPLFVNFTEISDGVYKLNYSVVDTFGLKGVESSRNIILDNIAPRVLFIFPSMGGNLYGYVPPINVSIDERNLNYINYTINKTGSYTKTYRLNSSNSSMLIAKNSSRWILRVNDYLDSGVYHIRVLAVDRVGFVNYSTTNLTVDRSPIGVVFDGPTTSSGNTTNNWIFMNVSATSANGIGKIKFDVYNASGALYYTTVRSGVGNAAVNITNIPDGVYRFNATVNDTIDNRANSSTRVVNLDLDSINIIRQMPRGNNSYWRASSIQVRINLSDDPSYCNVDWNGTVYSMNLYKHGGSSYAYKDITGLANAKNYTYSFECQDYVGRTNVTKTYTVYVDYLAPVITVISPINNSKYANSAIWINYTVDSYDSTWWGYEYKYSCGKYSICTKIINQTYIGPVIYNSPESGDGYINIWIFANDTVNNNVSRKIRFMVDTVRPVVQIVYPSLSSGITTTNSTYVNVTLSEQGSKCNLVLNGTSYDMPLRRECLSYPYFCTVFAQIDKQLTFDKLYEYHVWCNDTFGNGANSSSRTLIASSALQLAYVGKTDSNGLLASKNYIQINTTVNTQDLINSTVRVYDGGGNLINRSYSTTNGYIFVNLTGLSPGVYRFNATAINSHRNVEVLATRTVSLFDDAIPPVVHNIGPAYGIVSSARVQNFTCNITDDKAVYNMSVYLYNRFGTVIAQNSSIVTGISNKTNMSMTLPYEMAYNWTCRGSDVFNKVWAQEGYYRITRDFQPPYLAYEPSTTGNYDNSRNISIVLNATDLTLDTVKVGVYNDSNYLINTSTYVGGSAIISFKVQVSADGIYRFNVTANDSLGRISKLYTLSTEVDTVIPTIDWAGGTTVNGTYTRTWIYTNVTSSDINKDYVTIRLFRNGVLYTSYSASGTHINFTDLISGNYVINATVFDLAGNVKSTGSRDIILDAESPYFYYVGPTMETATNVSSHSIAVNLTTEDPFQNYTIQLWKMGSGLIGQSLGGVLPAYHNFTGLADGIYVFNLSANNSLGNNIVSISRNVTLDTWVSTKYQNPTPSSGNDINNNFTVNVTVTDRKTEEIGMRWGYGGKVFNTTLYDNNLIQMVSFNNEINDRSLYGNNAYKHDYRGGSPQHWLLNTSYVSGKYGAAGIELSTTDDIVYFNDILPQRMSFTETFWMLRGNDQPQTISVGCPLDITNYENNRMKIHVQNMQDYGILVNTPGSGTWYFVAISFDTRNNETRVYINGNLSSYKDAWDPNYPMVWGQNCSFSGGVNYWEAVMGGKMDEWRVWNKTLSAVSIANMYKTNLQFKGSDGVKWNNMSTWEVTRVEKGATPANYTFDFYAVDYNGNENATGMRWYNIFDNTPPTLAYRLPTYQENHYKRTSILVNVTADDGHLANVTVFLYNATSLIAKQDTLSSPNFINFSGLVDGVYDVNSSAWDSYGNKGYLVTRQYVLDNLAPVVSFENPTTSSNEDRWISVNVSSIDLNRNKIVIKLYSDYGLSRTVNSTAARFFFNFTGLTNGWYYVNASGNDTSGNIAYTETRSFQISSAVSESYGFNYTMPKTGCSFGSGCKTFGCGACEYVSFNVSKYIQYNVSANGQTMVLPFYNITNNGTVALNLTIQLNQTSYPGVKFKVSTTRLGGIEHVCTQTYAPTTGCMYVVDALPHVLAVNVEPGANVQGWVFTDFVGVAGGTSVSRNMSITSVKAQNMFL
jgi:hypothetical protein